MKAYLIMATSRNEEIFALRACRCASKQQNRDAPSYRRHHILSRNDNREEINGK